MGKKATIILMILILNILMISGVPGPKNSGPRANSSDPRSDPSPLVRAGESALKEEIEKQRIELNGSNNLELEDKIINIGIKEKKFHYSLNATTKQETLYKNISKAEKGSVEIDHKELNKNITLEPLNNETKVENWRNITSIKAEIGTGEYIAFKDYISTNEAIKIGNYELEIKIEKESLNPTAFIRKIEEDQKELQKIKKLKLNNILKYETLKIELKDIQDQSYKIEIRTYTNDIEIKKPYNTKKETEEGGSNTTKNGSDKDLNNNSTENNKLESLNLNMSKEKLTNSLETIYRNYPDLAIDLENSTKFKEYIETSNKDLNELHNILGKSSSVGAEGSNDITELQKELNEKEKEIENLKKLNEELETKLNITNANVEELKEEIDQLEQRNRELKQKIKKLKEKKGPIGTLISKGSKYMPLIERYTYAPLILGLVYVVYKNRKKDEKLETDIDRAAKSIQKNQEIRGARSKIEREKISRASLNENDKEAILTGLKEVLDKKEPTRYDIKQMKEKEIEKAAEKITNFYNLETTAKNRYKEIIKRLGEGTYISRENLEEEA